MIRVARGVGHDGNAYSPAERRLSICRTSLVNRSESSTGSRSSNASSEGSSVQPSMGIPLADGTSRDIIRESRQEFVCQVASEMSNECRIVRKQRVDTPISAKNIRGNGESQPTFIDLVTDRRVVHKTYL